MKERTQEEWQLLFRQKNKELKEARENAYDSRQTLEKAIERIKELEHFEKTIEILKDIILKLKGVRE